MHYVRNEKLIIFLGNDSDSEFEDEVEDDLPTEEVDDTSNSNELNFVCPLLSCNEKFHGSVELMYHVQENHPPRGKG